MSFACEIHFHVKYHVGCELLVPYQHWRLLLENIKHYYHIMHLLLNCLNPEVTLTLTLTLTPTPAGSACFSH